MKGSRALHFFECIQGIEGTIFLFNLFSPGKIEKHEIPIIPPTLDIKN